MKRLLLGILSLVLLCGVFSVTNTSITKAHATDGDYFTIYDADDSERVVLVRGDGIYEGDQYISGENKLYIIEEIDDTNRTGKARFIENVKMPVYNVKKKNVSISEVNAASKKIIGMYNTHNDECYLVGDGTDSVYGKGGIHDVSHNFKGYLEKLGIEVIYNESLHLPHNSGAYTRSEQTAAYLLKNYGVDAIFDLHRDATPRSEYVTKVHGVSMSKVRMVVGAANKNSQINKEFALCIKSYADEVYPGLIKDIYIGKGNYNQQLSSRAMLFEMGAHTVEKELVMASCEPLSKVIDIVLYGTKQASAISLDDIEVIETSNPSDLLLVGLARTNAEGNIEVGTPGELDTLWVVLGALGGVFVVAVLFYIFSPRSRQAINRFFSELTAGIFGRKKSGKVNDSE